MEKYQIITDTKLVKNSKTLKTMDDVFLLIKKTLVTNSYIKENSTIINDLKAREEKISTGIGKGLAIPHAVVKDLKESKVVIIRSQNSIEWDSLDKKPVNLIISILVPANKSKDHFEILSKLAGELINDSFTTMIKNSSPSIVSKNINNVLNMSVSKPIVINNKRLDRKKKVLLLDSPIIDSEDKQIKLVGVTTCPTGVAHTFIAAKAIEIEALKRDWKVKIEKQGQMTKDVLSEKDIKNADYVLIAKGKGIDEPERFIGKKVYETDVAEPITKAKKVLDDVISNAVIYVDNKNNKNIEKSKITAKDGKKKKKKFGTGPIRHLMTGISYMIPFIAFAGIVLGFTTAFGFDNVWVPEIPGTPPGDGVPGEWIFMPTSPAAEAFNAIAGTAFTLFIPILGGFIANSISGRAAIAPAMILSLLLNDGSGVSMFNYETLTFGGFEDSVALGFFGAIAAGYMIGYGVQWSTKHTDKIEMRWFQSILPLLLIPIFWTLIPWFFMAFVGYLPLYWTAQGLSIAVEGLIDNNLMWIAGMMIGGMICFDLGGPINKIAMAIALLFLSPGDNYNPLINGIAAVAVSIPPMIVLTQAGLGRFLGAGLDTDDTAMATSAGIMGFFGITEGSIPFAAKSPKTYIPSFVFAGMIGGIIASFMNVGNNVGMWGGPIIYIAGGMGNASLGVDQGYMETDWLYAAKYFIPLVSAALIGFLSVVGLTHFWNFNDKRIENKKANEKKDSSDKDWTISPDSNLKKDITKTTDKTTSTKNPSSKPVSKKPPITTNKKKPIPKPKVVAK